MERKGIEKYRFFSKKYPPVILYKNFENFLISSSLFPFVFSSYIPVASSSSRFSILLVSPNNG